MSSTSDYNSNDNAQSDRVRDQQLAYTTRSKEHPPKTSTPSKHEEKIRRLDAAKAKFDQLLPDLLKEHEGKYAAVMDDVVEIGEDRSKLWKTMIEKHGYKTMYISKITKEERVAEILSPSIKHDQKLQRFEVARKKFEELLPELLKEHKGKYAALIDDFVEIHEDKNTLIKIVLQKYGYRSMYFGEITTEERVVRLRSPRIKGI